jgi:hypothetical protein
MRGVFPCLLWIGLALAMAGCGRSAPAPTQPLAAPPAAFDPLKVSRETRNVLVNREAVVPSQCYTKTSGATPGIANPCWTCHTSANGRNGMNDAPLQEQYAFSPVGSTNHWTNLFEDLRPQTAKIDDAAALAWIRQDNYTPLREAMAQRKDFYGWKPDLDYRQGFDEHGFARDGSGWRAFRYKPFLGTFWPTNGATDDVLVRLPASFRSDANGQPSAAVYAANLAIIEVAVSVADTVTDAKLKRRVEPIDERAIGVDLDGDGKLGIITSIRGLPSHYVGGAAKIAVERFLYPYGIEFMHTVRYIDPDQPNLLSTRIREARYSIKRFPLDQQGIDNSYQEEAVEKDKNILPWFRGTPDQGFLNSFGWQLQGYIEDAHGRLRLQTTEEQYFCMGCHNTIGITVDSSFGFPRKLPGAAGWGWQSIKGIPDVPQAGQKKPETLTYFERVGGGDEFRANDEILSRFFAGGRLDESAVRSAAPGGDHDLAWLITPSRERALALDKAIMARVALQHYENGRDVVLAPAVNVHRSIVNGDTELKARGKTYKDGRLWLDWGEAGR